MVDIIIPAFNAHNTLRQTLGSICTQDEQKLIQVTLVDDYSNEPYDYLLKEFRNSLNLRILRKYSNEGSPDTIVKNKIIINTPILYSIS